MASCPRCGKQKVRKRKRDGKKSCPGCGVLPGIYNWQRNGSPAVLPDHLDNSQTPVKQDV